MDIKSLAAALPRLKTKVQLAGFVVLVAAVLIVEIISPNNIRAMLTAGSIGVSIIIFGQLFQYLELIPPGQRAILILVMFLIFCGFTVSMVVLTAGFINEESFALTVRAHSKSQPKIQTGQVTVECGDFRRTESFNGDNGEANFKGVPRRCWGSGNTRFLPDVNGFAKDWQTLKITSSAVDLELSLLHIIGKVIPRPTRPGDVQIVVDEGEERSTVDSDGRFDIPVSNNSGSVRVQVFVMGKVKYDSYQTVREGVTITLPRSTGATK